MESFPFLRRTQDKLAQGKLRLRMTRECKMENEINSAVVRVSTNRSYVARIMWFVKTRTTAKGFPAPYDWFDFNLFQNPIGIWLPKALGRCAV